MSAAGGTSVPLMLDWLMWLSMPKVNAECENPENTAAIAFKSSSEQTPQNTCIQRRVLIQTKLRAAGQKERTALQV